jgi:hypothetical protein
VLVRLSENTVHNGHKVGTTYTTKCKSELCELCAFFVFFVA